MKLTRASSYAIHALVFMGAQRHSRPVASHTIALARGIPERFLLKVLKPLVAARVLHSIKGPNGGYRLARSPNEITLLDVLEAVDGPIRGQGSFSRMETDVALNRRLDKICDQAAEHARDQFQKVRLSELASVGAGIRGQRPGARAPNSAR
jgi:Rrf2 family protein